MILKIVIFSVIILIIVFVAVFLVLRIPRLLIPVNTSETNKLKLLDEWLDILYKKGKFNGTVLLSQQGKMLFSKSYGLDGAKVFSQLTDHSSYNLASVSKQFTAMGIVILNDQLKLNYQDKVSDYIPELSCYKDISIQHLLHHTSGLPDYMVLAVRNRSDTDIFTTSEMIALYKSHHPKLYFEPGTKFKYSNAGYVLLAEIIERVSGSSFQNFMTDNIFKPLHMNDTQVFNLLSEDQPDKRVYGFGYKFWVFGGKRKLKDLNYFDGVAGDGGVYSSVRDLNSWHEALRDGLLVSNETYKTAYTPARLANGSHTKYGFGWFINGDNSVEHAGGWQGFTSYIHRNLKKDELIIILDNSSNTLRVNSIGFRFNSIGLNLKYFMKTL